MAKVFRVCSMIASLMILSGGQAVCQAPASPSWSAAVAASGWSRIVPDLSAASAKAVVAAVRNLGDRDFLEKAWGFILLRDPESAYAYRISKLYGVPEDDLSDLSDAHSLGTRELYLALKPEVDRRTAAAKSTLAAKDALALTAFSRWLEDRAKDIEFSMDKFPVSPWVNSADQLAVAYFTEYRTVADASEAERYIACLKKLPAKAAGLSAAMDLRAKAGVVLPRGIYEYTLGRVRDIASAQAKSTPFYEAFETKLKNSSVPEGSSRTALLAKAEAAIKGYALPAWKSLADALERQRAFVPATGGAWSLPGGRDYYAACLARQTTTNLSADEIHGLGTRELAVIHAQMRKLFAALGYPKDASLGSLYAKLGNSEPSVSGRSLLDKINASIKVMDSRLGELVLVRPRIAVEAVWGDSGGYYMPPAADGSRPGRYFVASSDRRYAYDVATTVYHETIPGHHLQIARALEADLPGFLRAADSLGFTEGWALYAELLASEMGAYSKDIPGELGRLRMLALRAARLVADTGVNAKGWNYGQAADFLKIATGLDDGMIQSDVTRYFIEPGQATAYFIGLDHILALRKKCRAELGAKFDLRRFHEAVLGGGAIPLSVLSSVIDAFIEAEKKR